MTTEELSKVLENHKHWLNRDCVGWENMKADLRRADLHGANLSWADLSGAKGIPFIPLACPDAGAFIGWKKAYGGYIVKLQIPEDAKRSSAATTKCRCDKAVVLAIQNKDGADSGFTEVRSQHDEKFIYRIGETVSVDDFDENRFNECSTGIHFFINREEAVNY